MQNAIPNIDSNLATKIAKLYAAVNNMQIFTLTTSKRIKNYAVFYTDNFFSPNKSLCS